MCPEQNRAGRRHEDRAPVLRVPILYETWNVSLGQASRTAGQSKRDFLERLGQQQVTIINYPHEELREEISE